MGALAGIYYIVADNHRAGDWLVIEVIVDGPACVVGRWATQAEAERDAARWTAVAEDVAA